MPVEHFYEFDNFRLYPDTHRLLHEHKAVSLTSKEFTLLLLLVRNGPDLVTYERIKEIVWPDVHVEEKNITQTIYKLRVILGDNSKKQQFIENVPRRGYRFVAHVREHEDRDEEIPPRTIIPVPEEISLQRSSIKQGSKSWVLKSLISMGAVFFICLFVGLIWKYVIEKTKPTPHVNNVTLLTKPTSGTQFYVQIDGNGFDPDDVRIVITGPGCLTFGACCVPNGAIKQFGVITYSRIERVPITAGFGDYHIFVQNGTTSETSEGFLITIGLAGSL